MGLCTLTKSLIRFPFVRFIPCLFLLYLSKISYVFHEICIHRQQLEMLKRYSSTHTGKSGNLWCINTVANFASFGLIYIVFISVSVANVLSKKVIHKHTILAFCYIRINCYQLEFVSVIFYSNRKVFFINNPQIFV